MPRLWCDSQHRSYSRPARGRATNLWPALLWLLHHMPSKLCLPPPYHWQHRGVISHIHISPTWCSCLFVCLFFGLYVGFAASFYALTLTLSVHTQTHNYCFPPSLFFSVSHTQTQASTYALPKLISCSDDAGRLMLGRIVNMIDSFSVKWSAQTWCLL